MEQSGQKIYSVRDLSRWLENEKDIVIYGAGDYGTKIIDYLFFIKESNKIKGIIVTEKGNSREYRGIKIQKASDFFEKSGHNPVMIAVSSTYQENIIQVVQQYGKQYCCMTKELYWDLNKRLMDPRPYIPYKGIDFLCPGFGKCGTTSLYNVLKQLEKIYLPERKENHFLQWCDDVQNSEELLIGTYYNNIREGQKVGMIDPTYAWEAKRTYDFLGDKLKIIFLVRNPVDAAFSGFKMAARQGRGELESAYQKNGGAFSVEIFEEHFKRDKEGFKYIDWIREFEKYYSKEQLKVVFLEEMLSAPQTVINNILDYIGVEERYIYEYLPASNKGSFVMADLEGYQLAKQKLAEKMKNWNICLYNAGKEDENEGVRAELEKRYTQAPKIYDVKMTKEQRRKTEIYYNTSVRELEKWLNRDLTQIWF